jgi:hypothetical protein
MGNCPSEPQKIITKIGSGGACKRTLDKYNVTNTKCITFSGFDSQHECNVLNQGPMISIGTGNCSWYNGDCASTGKKALCIRKQPINDANTYACCTKPANSTSADICGTNFCPNSDYCNSYMSDYCKQGQNMTTDSNCVPFRTDAEMSEMCKSLDKFTNPTCQSFCENAFQNKTPSFGACLNTAIQYCATPAGKADQKCSCLNVKDTDDYKNLMKTKPGIETDIGNYQCYWPTCVGATSWASAYRQSIDQLGCPSCAQSIKLDNVTADSINKIEQSCKSSSDSSSGSGSGSSSSPGTPSGDSSNTNITSNNKVTIIIIITILLILLIVGIII